MTFKYKGGVALTAWFSKLLLCSSLLSYKNKVMRSKEYTAFCEAYDNIDISKLSDEELKDYANKCDNGLIEANRELYKRGI